MFESVCTLFRSVYRQNKSYAQIFSLRPNSVNVLNCPGPSTVIPSRTTIIVKRPFPPALYREGKKPKFRKRTYYFDFVEDTNNRPDPIIDIVLSSYIEGVGNPGDLVSMKRTAAYNKFLVTGLADYATPEMIEYSKKIKADEKLQEKQISPSVERCMKYLQETRLSIQMNQYIEWTIEPWHIRANARKAGIHILSDDSIELPAKPIKGPDMALEGKEFFVTVTINKKVKLKVRCRVHHWTNNVSERMPLKPQWWLEPAEMIFPEDEQEIKENLPPTNPS